MSKEQKAIAGTLLNEAGGDGYEGMEAVAWVIKNRMDKQSKSAYDIISAPHQFQGFTDEPDTSHDQYDKAMELAKKLEDEEDPSGKDPTDTSYFFANSEHAFDKLKPPPKKKKKIGGNYFFG